MSTHDFTVKFGGNGYRFDVFVNTNEDPREVAVRLQRAARGQIKAACLVGVASLTKDEVAGFMKKMAEIASTGAGTEFKIDDDTKE